MSPEQRIEEAHGLWELEAAFLAGAVAMFVAARSEASAELIRQAAIKEREAFGNWQRVSKECGA